MQLDSDKQGRLEASAEPQAVVTPQQGVQSVSAGAAAQQQDVGCRNSNLRARPGMLVHIEQTFDPKLAGTHIQLQTLLGSGGFASVYSGIVSTQQTSSSDHTTCGKESGVRVAVKVFDFVRPGVSTSLLQQLAAKELETMLLLQQQAYVIKVLGSGWLLSSNSEAAQVDADTCSSTHQVRCVVLELTSHTLSKALDCMACISEADAKVMVRQLAQQLGLMHSGHLGGKVLLHSDIKPDNVLLRLNGDVAICDFGACNVFDIGINNPAAPAFEVQINCLFATPYYAAPELYRRVRAARTATKPEDGDTGSIKLQHSDRVVVDTSMDVFGLGVLALRMLVGPLESLYARAPRDVESADAWEKVLAQIVDRQLPLPAQVQLSDGALQFIGCACGVGSAREAAASHNQPKRLSAAQLLLMPWLQ